MLIRAFDERDGDERFAVFTDPELRRYFGHGETRFESDKQLVRDIRDQGRLRWSLAVCDRESSRMIGACVMREWDSDCELVLGLVKEFRGMTLGTELASAALDAVFADVTVRRVVARVAPENTRSLSLMASLGMQEVASPSDDRKFAFNRPVPNNR